ncbi:MAG: polysaccharide deacetylase family protein [Anaerolineales bacterium]|nr:polysaccharide deacetylase family protein [Anaerolineales bacterium]
MKKILIDFLKTVLGWVPLSIYKWVFPQKSAGFFFHAVSDAPMPHVDQLYQPISAERFENALVYLKEKFTMVSYEDLEADYLGEKPLSQNAAHLSFDDGFVECFDIVRPLLLKHEVPCTFFVATDWIDNKNMFYRNKVSLCIDAYLQLSEDEAREKIEEISLALDKSVVEIGSFPQWMMSLVQADEPMIDQVCGMLGMDVKTFLKKKKPFLTLKQIKQLDADGFTIGSHTRSHSKLVQVTEKEMEEEIVESSKIIQKITGNERVPFSFPNSATGIDRNRLQQIRERNPILGLFFDTKGLRKDELYILNRIWCERRGYAKAGKGTNLPVLLHLAYQDLALDTLLKSRGNK